MTSSTKTGQSSKPSVSVYFNPKKIYLVPRMPKYNDPTFASRDPSNKETRYVGGFSAYSILEPADTREINMRTAEILASAYKAGKEEVEELRTYAKNREQKQPCSEETTNASLVSKWDKVIDMTQSKASTYKVEIIRGDAPSQKQYERYKFRQHNVQELDDVEARVREKDRRVDVDPPTIHERKTVIVGAEKPDDCVIHDDGGTW
jgi:hypothetical protein